MAYRTEHRQTITGVYETGCELRLSTATRDDFKEFNHTGTLRISTGPVHLQTYLTADDLRSLAYACLKAALDLDAIATESQVLEVAAQ